MTSALGSAKWRQWSITPPAQECTSLPTAVQITTTWVTCSNRSLSSYIYGPKHPDQGVRTPSRSSRGGPSRLFQLLGVREPLGLWSHPPNLCSIVTRPLPSVLCVFHKDDACWFWGHPGDSGQPHLEISDCLPLGKDPFFKYDCIPRFQSSGQEPISGGPLLAIVTGQQPQTGRSSDARRSHRASDQTTSIDKKAGAVDGRGLRATSLDGADWQGWGS